MSKQFYKDAFGWGIALWLFGYILGFIFFMLVPANLLGWFIMPFGIGFALWVLFKKVKIVSRKEFLMLAVIWTVLAVVLDYFLLVKILKPADGYYKLDVYLYYIITFILPIAMAWKKKAV